MVDRLPQLLRADAADNRERVLDSARLLFAQRGLEVPMREIARKAEVGPATLYRRFPTKQALIDAAFADELLACQGIVREGYEDVDPWRGFCSVIMRIGELNARNHGFIDAFLSTFPDAIDIAAHREGMLRSLADLARRAKQVGALRGDFVLDDFVLILMAGRGLTASNPQARVDAARRFSALAIEAFRATGSPGELPPPARLTAARTP